MTVDYILCGDSWAEKAYNDNNYNKYEKTDQDVCISDMLTGNYSTCTVPGYGNLCVLDELVKMDIDPDIPLLWIFTEPGRDWSRVYNVDEFDWLKLENYTELRQECIDLILKEISCTIKNPIAFIGGLSDFTAQIELPPNWTVLHKSWQEFIANQLPDSRFNFGWGASDVGWRMFSDNIVPSQQLTFMWDEQIKEWCYWEENGYFCHEHPTLKATYEFAEFISEDFNQWLNKTKATK